MMHAFQGHKPGYRKTIASKKCPAWILDRAE